MPETFHSIFLEVVFIVAVMQSLVMMAESEDQKL